MNKYFQDFKQYIYQYKIILIISVLIALFFPFLIKMPALNVFGIAIIWVLLLIIPRTYKIIYYLFLGILIILTIYGLAGSSYGVPNYALIASILETNQNESAEFIKSISIKNWLVMVTGLLLVFIYAIFNYRLGQKTNINNKASMIVCGILSVLLFFISDMYMVVQSGYNAYQEYTQEKQILLDSLIKDDSWQITEKIATHKDYKNYVLVIGESARKDYMSVYGYPHQNTLFFNEAHGTFVDGVYAMGSNTISSLARTLQKTKDGNGMDILPENNIITLANKAGLHTYWLSNQGFLGKYDSATSTIAMRANEKIFLKKASYHNDGFDDFELLPKLDDVLKNPKPKLIVLHLMGSHPDPCNRLNGFPIDFNVKNNQKLNCYIASLQKTDIFLAEVVEKLKQYQDFSLIYFSDHAVSVTEQGVIHDPTILNSYEVPFALINSDDNEHKVVKKPFSQIHFLDLYASWLGVKTNMTDDAYNIYKLDDLPENKDIKVFDMQKMVDIGTLPKEMLLE